MRDSVDRGAHIRARSPVSPGDGIDSFGGAPDAITVQPAPASPPPTASPPTPPVEVQATDEAVKSYIERCVHPQQVWFSRKAAKCKRAHYTVITAQVVATTSIPLLNMLILNNPKVAYISTAAAAISGLAAGFASFGKFKEHWLRYRQNATTLENLQLEYELFLPPFDGPDRNNLLINTVRRILADEQKLWIADVSSGTVAKVTTGSVTPIIPPRSYSQSRDSDDN